LKIGLPQPNFDVLEKHLYEVSDPSHSRYGQYLSKAEVEALVAPHPESLDLVNDWLASHGIGEEDMIRSPAQDWVTVTVPVRLAEKMLDTTYHVWTHGASGESIVRTTSYSLPIHLHEHIEVVQPTTTFARLKGFKSTIHSIDKHTGQIVTQSNAPVATTSGVSVDPSCNSTITVTCLKQLYNAVNVAPSATINNSFAVTGYLEQFANFQDLQSFYALEVPEAVNTSFKVVSVAGGQNNQSLAAAGDEADLDTQFGYGITFPIPGTFFTTAGSPPFIPDLGTPTDTNEPYITWLDFILAQKDIPLVISTSYGDDE
jgi:tripeptidyl-peptidase-1